MKLVGQKVYLKPIALAYAQDYVNWFADQEVLRYTDISPKTFGEEQAWVKRSIQSEKEEVFNIFIQKNNKLIGNIGVENLDHPERNFLLGIVIGVKSEWGKGYASDAFHVLLKYLFEVKHAQKLHLFVRVENEPAISVYKKCGFEIMRKVQKFLEKEQCDRDYYEMELESKSYNAKS